jgi:hypothetical protein
MVRLLTVIGHGTNLIEHHINHYLGYVDEIQYVVYETVLYPSLLDEVEKITKKYKKVSIVKTLTDRVFDWEKVTELYNEIKLTQPNDWWVIADIDEFHLYPNNSIRKIIYDCDENGWEIVRGGFIDRVGKTGEFAEITSDKNIFEQFSTMCFFRYPLSKACPNKICIIKGHIEITFGQHYAKVNGHTTWKWQGWSHPLIAPIDTHSVQVHHFKWDKTCVDRIKAVAYNNEDYSFSNEYRLLYKELKKSEFKIDLNNSEYMVVLSNGTIHYNTYNKWNSLIKKIILI